MGSLNASSNEYITGIPNIATVAKVVTVDTCHPGTNVDTQLHAYAYDIASGNCTSLGYNDDHPYAHDDAACPAMGPDVAKHHYASSIRVVVPTGAVAFVIASPWSSDPLTGPRNVSITAKTSFDVPQCNPCEKGFSSTAGSSTCTACSKGQSAVARGGSCGNHTSCPAGFGVMTAGTTTADPTCAACVTGTTFSAADNGDPCGSVTALCAAGQTESAAPTFAADRVCTACAAGKYNAVARNEACTPATICGAGQHQSTAGTNIIDRTCVACGTGKFSAALTNSLTCSDHSNCASGQYQTTAPSVSQDRVCTECPPGNQAASINSLACTAHSTCAPGTGVSQQGTHSTNPTCSACTLGSTYSDTNDKSACKAVTNCVVILSNATVSRDANCTAPAVDSSSSSGMSSVEIAGIVVGGAVVLALGAKMYSKRTKTAVQSGGGGSTASAAQDVDSFLHPGFRQGALMV